MKNKANINEMNRRRALYRLYVRRATKEFLIDAPEKVKKEFKILEKQRKQYI